MALRLSAADAKRFGVKLAAPKVAKKPPTPVKSSPARWSFTLSVPMTVRSEANLRQHWAVKLRRKNEQREALVAAFIMSPVGSRPCEMPVVVTLTHIGRRMDCDNLANAFKGARDWIASAILSVDDGDPQVTWRYEQRAGKPGVELRIEKE